MTPATAASSLRKFAFLFDNAVLSSMSAALVRARLAAVTQHMLPKSQTSPVHPTKLTHRSGRLGRSVRVERPRIVAGRFMGKLIAGGLNILYAAAHEFGATFTHPGGTPYIIIERGISFVRKEHAAQALAHGGGVTKPHKITLPARPFVRPAVEGEVPGLREDLARKIAAARSQAGL